MVLRFLGDLGEAIHFPLTLVSIWLNVDDVSLIDYPLGYDCRSWVLVLDGGTGERFVVKRRNV